MSVIQSIRKVINPDVTFESFRRSNCVNIFVLKDYWTVDERVKEILKSDIYCKNTSKSTDSITSVDRRTNSSC